MLVQAQVVALGKRGDRQSSPSGTNPSRASPTGRRIGGYDYKTESFQRPRVEHYTRFREMKKFEFFWCPSPGGRSVREITSREETERPPEESARQIPAGSRLSQEPKARWRSGSADRTAPEQISQAPGLREFRLAESQQILPLIGNRKPASDRTHWLRPAPCSSRRRSLPWWGTGRPAELSPSGFHPVTGTAYRQEDRRVRLQNRVVSTTARRALHTLSRNEEIRIFLVPLPWGSECSGNY